MPKYDFTRDRLIMGQELAKQKGLTEITLGEMLTNPQNGGKAAAAWDVIAAVRGDPVEVKTGADDVCARLVDSFMSE